MAMTNKKTIVVVGSVNLDIVVSVERLPVAGETVSGGDLNHFPGGKGANQALAARRLGADVALVACVGDDGNADEALALLVEGGVDLSRCSRVANAATGVALIAVSAAGENQIVVVPGANRLMDIGTLSIPHADALICQLEVPAAVLQKACATFDGFVSINLAPAMNVPAELISRANLIVVNETEAKFYGEALSKIKGMLAITYGGDDAVLYMGEKELARATPPRVSVVDTTGAGDTFTAALTLALIEGMEPQGALDFACAAGAAATQRAGAQPALPRRDELT